MASRRAAGSEKSALIKPPSSAGFIRCDKEGHRMTDGVAMEESPAEGVLSGMPNANSADLEFAERIIERLKPRNQQDLYNKAARQSKLGGMLITLMVVIWWLFIKGGGDNMDEGISVFFNLDFGQVALAVMGLSLVSAILTEFSRDVGKILPSSAAGGMLILAGLYVAEPLVASMFITDFLTFEEGTWRTVRLGILWGGMSVGSNQLVNALLLNWLIKFLDSNGIGIDSTGRGDSVHDMASTSALED